MKFLLTISALAAGLGLGRLTAQIHRLEVIGPNGAVAAALESHGSGAGMLILYDPAGRPAIQLSAAEGGRLSLAGPTGKESIYLGPLEDGQGIWIRSPAGAAIRLEADSDGRGRAVLSDGEGRTLELSARPAVHSLEPERLR
ncbi:MAG: hypothetical protein AAFX94_05360 [Myxococcota bacterium]